MPDLKDFRRRVSLMVPFVFCCVSARAGTPAQGRMSFPDSMREVPAVVSASAGTAAVTRAVLRPEETAAVMTFEVGLRMRNFDEMQARIAKGELISDAEKEARYFPLAADHDRIVRWLRDQDLEVTRTDGNRLGIFGRGTVGSVGRAFQVSFARVSFRGEEFTSGVTAPSVPVDLSPLIVGIHGLQPHIRRRPLSTPRTLQPNAQVNLTGYVPSQIAKAYNADGLSVTGAGQTIAIYAFAYPQNSDLTAFWTAANVTQSLSNVQTVDVAGGPTANTNDNTLKEVALDVEWASSLAPGAKIRIYGASEADPANNDEILQQVYADLPSQPNMRVLSISIGGNEMDVPRDYLIIEAQYMANLASAGVTVLVASGDSGATSNGLVQTSYPTSDPDVTGVGGTSLTLDANGNLKSESTWTGSGGGKSVVFSRPAWQTGAGVPAGAMRLVPDVASAADPNEGAMIVYNGKQIQIGGTSWSAPTWAAFCALINEKRGSPLGLLNPKIYPLSGTASLRDITTGNNGAYNAGVGYDLCTGVGVPVVSALLAATLTSSSAANVPAPVESRVVTLGQPATFFVVGAGAPPLSYRWQRLPKGSTTWSNLSDTGTYNGSATPLLVVNGATSAMSGDQFQCAVTNAGATAVSAPPALLTVNPVGVTTLAGWPGSAGSANGTGRAARFANPGGVRVDGAGNIYVADSSNYAVRKVSASGVVTTVAGVPAKMGSTDGPAATALFSGIGGVAFNASGDLYVADAGNYTIRKISASGVVSTLAGLAGTRGAVDGTGSQARLFDPQNLAVDGSGNIYVADGMGNVVRMITPGGVVTTIAGSGASGSADGTGIAAQFNDLTGIAVDPAGNLYVADYANDTVRKITPDRTVTTLAGTALSSGSVDGSGAAARFNGPAGLGVDSSGNVYVADSKNSTIRKITTDGFVTTVAGAAGHTENIDGLSTDARFDAPGDVTIDTSGIVYVADALNDTIRRIIPGADSAPFFTAEPANQTVTLGAPVTFSFGIAGTAPLSFQWFLNGSPIPGATNPSYTVAQAQQTDAGSYSVSVTNIDGSVKSSAATLAISLPAGYPNITAQPQGAPLPSGGSVNLSVTVSGNGPFTYQWMLNGAPIAGATSPAYAASVGGSYTVSVTNSVATAISSPAIVGFGSRLINISSRSLVQAGAGIAIAGFVIEGPAGISKQVLIRGIGPTLANFSVANVLAKPTITLFNASNASLASNTAWGSNANPALVAALSAQVGAFALPSGSADSALIANLTPGQYSVELSGADATPGVGLVEVYEADTTVPELLANISTRASVGTGANILIAGFVVLGTQPAKVLIRGVGPALGTFNVSGFLTQPVLTVFNSSNTAIATNTGWQTASNPSEIASVGTAVGAFALPGGSADSALVLTLQPGTYSAEVSGANGTTGIALVEVYQAAP